MYHGKSHYEFLSKLFTSILLIFFLKPSQIDFLQIKKGWKNLQIQNARHLCKLWYGFKDTKQLYRPIVSYYNSAGIFSFA